MSRSALRSNLDAAKADVLNFMAPGQEYTEAELAEACCLTRAELAPVIRSLLRQGYAKGVIRYVRTAAAPRRRGRPYGYSAPMWQTLAALSCTWALTARDLETNFPDAGVKLIGQRLGLLFDDGWVVRKRRGTAYAYRRSQKPVPPGPAETFGIFNRPQENADEKTEKEA